jgi:hypothetical protein
MQAFRPAELDVLSRAFYRALDRVRPCARDVEEAKTVLMTSILAAAKTGELDEDELVRSALAAMHAHESGALDGGASAARGAHSWPAA